MGCAHSGLTPLLLGAEQDWRHSATLGSNLMYHIMARPEFSCMASTRSFLPVGTHGEQLKSWRVVLGIARWSFHGTRDLGDRTRDPVSCDDLARPFVGG